MKQNKILLGAHTSAAGGAPNALIEGASIGATTIQLFTSNQKQWHGRTIEDKEIETWHSTLKETGISHVMSHASYLINLGSPKQDVLIKSKKAFAEEILRCQSLGLTYLNFHPGSALNAPVETCLETIVESLLECEKLVNQGSLTLLLETTAGQGSCVGHRFDELKHIIEQTHKKIPIGVCIDTCHIFAAGYDIRTEQSWNNTLQIFDEKIGISYLKALHLNDSMKPLGSKVDRHAPLGEGEIGLECFKIVMQHPLLKHLPKYLETPNGPNSWAREIALLKGFYL